MNRWLLAYLTALIVVTSAGCGGGGASIQSWQKGVERYIQVTGGGNPTVLRDVKLPDGRRGFSVLGSADPRESTDVNAVLLGHEPVQGKPRFIYLVGVVKKLAVEDIRLASLAVENGKYNWSIAKKDDAALQTYRGGGKGGFPLPADQFELSVSDPAITATHRASGARWELPVK